jgi:hypothetical protein
MLHLRPCWPRVRPKSGQIEVRRFICARVGRSWLSRLLILEQNPDRPPDAGLGRSAAVTCNRNTDIGVGTELVIFSR